MLNKDFFDESERQVIAMRQKIEQFKAYDEERKKYVKSLQNEIEQRDKIIADLNSKISELESGAYATEHQRAEAIRNENKILRDKLKIYANYPDVSEMMNESEMDMLAKYVKTATKVGEFKKRYTQLREMFSCLSVATYQQKDIDTIISRINKWMDKNFD